MPDIPKILKPGQINVQMNPQMIPVGEKLQMQIATPEGSQLMVIFQIMDYNWEKDQVQIAVGQVDLLAEARKGNIMNASKGINP